MIVECDIPKLFRSLSTSHTTGLDSNPRLETCWEGNSCRQMSVMHFYLGLSNRELHANGNGYLVIKLSLLSVRCFLGSYGIKTWLTFFLWVVVLSTLVIHSHFETGIWNCPYRRGITTEGSFTYRGGMLSQHWSTGGRFEESSVTLWEDPRTHFIWCSLRFGVWQIRWTSQFIALKHDHVAPRDPFVACFKDQLASLRRVEGTGHVVSNLTVVISSLN